MERIHIKARCSLGIIESSIMASNDLAFTSFVKCCIYGTGMGVSLALLHNSIAYQRPPRNQILAGLSLFAGSSFLAFETIMRL